MNAWSLRLSFFILLLLNHANCCALIHEDSTGYVVKPFHFRTLDKKYRLEGEILLPHQHSSNGMLVIFAAAPSIPANRHYYGFFDVLAKYLVNLGIAVLRFDNRNYSNTEFRPNQLTMLDLADDVHSAFIELKKDSTLSGMKVGVLGHSEGGSAALIEAANNSEIGFCVALASSGEPGDRLALYQLCKEINRDTAISVERRTEQLGLFNGIVAIIKSNQDLPNGMRLAHEFMVSEYEKHPQLKDKSARALPPRLAASIDFPRLLAPRIVQYIRYDPSGYLRRVKCPVLFVYGSLDQRINVSGSINYLNTIASSLKIRPTVINLDGLNHGFQEVDSLNNAISGTSFEADTIKSIPINVLTSIKIWLKPLTAKIVD